MEKLNLKSCLIVGLLLLLAQCTSIKAEPIGTGFTYQGQLTDTDVPANGLYDFEFKLFDAPAGGNQVGPTLSFFDVFVDDGYFMAELEFPNDDPLRFWGSGEARWLEIAVRPFLPIAEIYPMGEPGISMDTPGYTILSPRTKITPTPYALHALTSSTGPGPGPGPMVGTDNYIPRWLGTTGLENSVIYQTDFTDNIGIGTTTPDRKLHVVSAEDGQIKVKGTDPTRFGGLVLCNDRDDAYEAGIVGVGGSSNPDADIQNSLFLSPPGDFDIVFQHSGSTKAIIKPDGKVGIGTTAPGRKLDVAGTIKTSGSADGIWTTAGWGKRLEIPTAGVIQWLKGAGNTISRGIGFTTDDKMYFIRSSADDNSAVANYDMVIDKNGNVGIGMTNPGLYKLNVAGNAYATGIWHSSDLRFKENIETIDSPIDKIKDIRGVSFEWKTAEYKDKGFPEGRHYGFIAQEIEHTLPDVVKEGPDGEKAVSYTDLVPILAEAIKEQQKQIESLRSEVHELREVIQQHRFTATKEVLQ